MPGEARERGGRLRRGAGRLLGRTPQLSDEQRLDAARQEATTHLARGETAQAEEAVRGVLDCTDRPRLLADLLHDVTRGTLATGEEPGLLLEAYAAQLRLADTHLQRGRVKPAAASFARGLQLAFDRNVHFDSTTSPLAQNPGAFTAPLRESAVAQRLHAARGRAVTDPRESRPVRVVVATRGNDTFLGPMLDLLEEAEEVELTYVDLGADKEFSRGVFRPGVVVEEILTGEPGMAERAEAVLRPLLNEADVLFVEWCSALAVLVGLVDPGRTRVVVRLHSYEAFTHWPHMLDLSRIDDLLFVSEHLRDFAVDAIPGLQEEGAPRLEVLPLAKDLRGYLRPKSDEARFNVGLVGWGSVAKDPRWAFQVVRLLREHDARYRLLLVGSEFSGEKSAAAGRYAEQMYRELEALEAEGAVRRLGQTDDVAAALAEIGAILSASVRESFHAALVEGAASGAVPVVRDWPFFAGRATSARTLFPSDWIVGTADEAARRILAATADVDSWRAVGDAASEHALATWDWSVVASGYERFLLG